MVMRMVSPNPMFGSLRGPSPLAQGIMGPMSPAGVGGRPPMGMPPMGPPPMMGAPMQPQMGMPPMGMPSMQPQVPSQGVSGVGGTGQSRARFGAMLGGLGGVPVARYASGGSVDFSDAMTDADFGGWSGADVYDNETSSDDDSGSYEMQGPALPGSAEFSNIVDLVSTGGDDSYEGFSELGGSYGGGSPAGGVGFDYDYSTGTFATDDGGYITFDKGVPYYGETPTDAIRQSILGVNPIGSPVSEVPAVSVPRVSVSDSGPAAVSTPSGGVSVATTELSRPVAPVDAGIGAVSRPKSNFIGQLLGSAGASLLGLPASVGADLGGRLFGGVDLFAPAQFGPDRKPRPRPDVVKVAPGDYSFSTVAGDSGDTAYMATRDLPRFGIKAGESAVPEYGVFDPRSFVSTDPGNVMRNVYATSRLPDSGTGSEDSQPQAVNAAADVTAPACPEGFVFDSATNACVPALFGGAAAPQRSLDDILARMGGGGSRSYGAPMTAVPVAKPIGFADGGGVSAPGRPEIFEMISRIAGEEGVDPEIFRRLVSKESSYNPTARSKKGAIGYAQLMPSTAKELGVDPYDPEQNLRGGARYLRQMMDRFGSLPLALAAYNAGPTAVSRYEGIPPFAETRDYVAAIMNQDTSRSVAPPRRPDRLEVDAGGAGLSAALARLAAKAPRPKLNPMREIKAPRPVPRPQGLTDSEVSMSEEISRILRGLSDVKTPVKRMAMGGGVGSLEGAADRFLSRLGAA